MNVALNKNCRIVDVIQGKVFAIAPLDRCLLRGAAGKKYKNCSEYAEEVWEKYVFCGHNVFMSDEAQKAKNNYLFMRLVRNIWQKPPMC